MQRQLIQTGILLIFLPLLLSACLNDPGFSNTPSIAYQGFIPFKNLPARPGVGGGRRDSLVIHLTYQDGDSDLGENTPRTKADSLAFLQRYNDGWGNYQIRAFQFENGKFTEVPLDVNRSLFFPPLTREGQRGSIEGDLYFQQVFYYTRNARILPLKFQIKIRDRQLRESNTIETDTISLPILTR